MSLLAPSRRDLNISVLGADLDPTSIQYGESRGYRYDFGPAEADEMLEGGWPRDVAGIATITAKVRVSWSEIATAYREATEPILQSADVAQMVQTIQAATSDPAEQRKLASEMVRDDIRYVALELGENAIIPHPPAETINNGYGDCKDKASVLVAVLRGLGQDAWLTLINSGIGLDANPDVPNMGQFNHAIVAMGTGDTLTFVDPTDASVPVNELPFQDQARNVLVIRPGTTALVQTPISFAADNTWRTTYTLRLNEGGEPAVTEVFAGQGRLVAHSRDLDPAPHTQRMREYEEWAEETYDQELTLLELASEGDDAKQSEWTESRVWETLPMGFSDGTEATVIFDFAEDVTWPLPRPVLLKDTDDWVLADRPFGVRIDPFDLTVTWDVEVPEGFVSMYAPRDEQETFGGVSFSRTTESKDGHMVTVVTLSSDAITLSVADSVRLRDWAYSELQGNAWQAQWTDSTQTLIEQGQSHEALQILARRTAADSERMYSRASLALMASKLGFGDLAVATAESMRQDFPEEAVAHRMVTAVSLSDPYGRHDETTWDSDAIVSSLEKALELEPDNDSSLKLRAVAQMMGDQSRQEMGESAEEAIKDLKKLSILGIFVDDSYMATPMLYSKRYDLIRSYGAGREELVWRTVVAAATWAETGSVPGFDNPTTRLAIAGHFVAAEDLESARAVVEDIDPDDPNLSGEAADLVRQLQFRHTRIDPRRNPEDAVRAMLLAGARNEPVSEFFVSGYSKEGADDDDTFDPDSFDSDGIPGEAVLELMACADLTSEGDDALGYQIKGQTEGSEHIFAYVVREGNRYKITASSTQHQQIGERIMEHLERGDEASARTWLAWVLEAQDSQNLGESPLNTEPMVWMWRHGQTEDVELVTQLLRLSDDDIVAIRAAIPELSADDKTAVIRRIAGYYIHNDQNADAFDIIKQLPDITFREPQIARWATRLAEDVEQLEYVQQRVLDNGPAHPAIETYLSKWLYLKGQEDKLTAWDQGVRLPTARSSDIMNFTWFLPMFDEARLPEALRMARRQASSRHLGGNELHTLATLELASGNWQRASDAHVQAISQLEPGETLAEDWFAVRAQLLASWGMFDAANEALRLLAESEDEDTSESATFWNDDARSQVAALQAEAQ
jgi:hypothetical protein